MANIVYLDDESELLNIFEILFDGTGHNVSTFSDEQLAIDYCSENAPDIAFIDFRLKKMMGNEVAAQLPEQIKKVLVTGDLNPNVNDDFNKVISKPFKLSQLLNTVEDLLA